MPMKLESLNSSYSNGQVQSANAKIVFHVMWKSYKGMYILCNPTPKDVCMVIRHWNHECIIILYILIFASVYFPVFYSCRLIA